MQIPGQFCVEINIQGRLLVSKGLHHFELAKSGNWRKSGSFDMRFPTRYRQEISVKQRQNQLLDHPAEVGGNTLWAITRRQSRPSSSIDNCARDTRITPS